MAADRALVVSVARGVDVIVDVAVGPASKIKFRRRSELVTAVFERI